MDRIPTGGGYNLRWPGVWLSLLGLPWRESDNVRMNSPGRGLAARLS